MAQGDVRCMVPKSRRRDRLVGIRVLTNKIVKSRTIHELSCGCLLDKGMFYHKVAAIYDGVFQANKGHAGPCPRSGVIH